VPVWMLSPKEEGQIHTEHASWARLQCKDVLQAFADCNKGRLLTTSWACGPEKRAMMDCMLNYMGDEYKEQIIDKFIQEKKERQ
ncbi:hypothetical protein V1512DRAFT_193116, partial [Lipomyces arxii]|uniref:uncharacterized protein n=1 Tax=Lipomyces arxii TaxID=56418 RepID=UPI0034CEB901